MHGSDDTRGVSGAIGVLVIALVAGVVMTSGVIDVDSDAVMASMIATVRNLMTLLVSITLVLLVLMLILGLATMMIIRRLNAPGEIDGVTHSPGSQPAQVPRRTLRRDER